MSQDCLTLRGLERSGSWGHNCDAGVPAYTAKVDTLDSQQRLIPNNLFVCSAARTIRFIWRFSFNKLDAFSSSASAEWAQAVDRESDLGTEPSIT
jgi:hypothetical protein